MRPIYRVIKHTLYEKCDVKRNYYTVEKQIIFMGFKWWKSLKETHYGIGDYGMGGGLKSPISFKTESDAIYAIKKLENGSIPEGWISEVSSVLDFNKDR
jgi:hypothetical protein